MLFRKELVMFGPREVLLTSEQPVVKQFLAGDRFGPIGMSEEKDEAVAAAEAAMQAAGIDGGTKDDFSEIIAQVQPNPGMPGPRAPSATAATSSRSSAACRTTRRKRFGPASIRTRSTSPRATPVTP